MNWRLALNKNGWDVLFKTNGQVGVGSHTWGANLHEAAALALGVGLEKGETTWSTRTD